MCLAWHLAQLAHSNPGAKRWAKAAQATAIPDSSTQMQEPHPILSALAPLNSRVFERRDVKGERISVRPGRMQKVILGELKNSSQSPPLWHASCPPCFIPGGLSLCSLPSFSLYVLDSPKTAFSWEPFVKGGAGHAN